MISPILTEKQTRVVHCVFQGLPNKDIAKKLGTTRRAVKSLKQQIFRKYKIDPKWNQTVRLVWLVSGGTA